ncbi:hypothetical protein SAMN05216188_102378 [Lentzea xinjiangensis]|uniref:DUF4367 domain-containing protein n=1 Tax=Lentzea xinjiangensis TaxID=402600 RepID=A0A1H9E529_9PSEU|nr:hypothetical protein [Lentzea xinjiangensis]SEQ20018.1 hypothetical protein SAMN05216188_102378 [Lentzea xinjiangensis]
MIDDELEAALRDLGRQIRVPAQENITAQVLTRINAPRKRHRRLTAVIAAVTAFAVAFAVSPAVRAGVRNLLEFAGVEFRTQPPASTAPPLPSQEVSLDAAGRLLPFEIHLPAALDRPEKVTVHEGRFATLHYRHVTLDQFDGTIQPVLGKLVHGEGVERIGDKVWIPHPHEIFYIDREGRWHQERPHGAGQTLIWQRGQVTMRLEGDLTRQRALEISES